MARALGREDVFGVDSAVWEGVLWEERRGRYGGLEERTGELRDGKDADYWVRNCLFSLHLVAQSC